MKQDKSARSMTASDPVCAITDRFKMLQGLACDDCFAGQVTQRGQFLVNTYDVHFPEVSSLSLPWLDAPQGILVAWVALKHGNHSQLQPSPQQKVGDALNILLARL